MKLFSFLIIKFYLSSFVCARLPEYCEICSNHTLCLFKNPGPSSKCTGYHENVFLRKAEANIIVNQINERRNFVATGRSKYLQAAANMKKIKWSKELATFAQRWADQCDPSLRPDKEDSCRNLEKVAVGQNIATIVGSTAGLNIKSFIEIWFMQSMYYTGSITFYNQSVDYKSNYFTQLIWADTEEVGCGRAKFFINNKKPVLVERLVCNFAPKGNNQGKPIYIMGYPASQCKQNMISDQTLTGLCTPISTPKPRRLKYKDATTTNSSSTSFLRILNLYNNLTTPDIDPIQLNDNTKSNLQWNLENNNNYKNHKSKLRGLLRHPYDAVKRSYPLDNEHFWRFPNRSQDHTDHHHKEKGHSRMYHGHNHKNEFDLLHPETSTIDSRRFDYTTYTVNLFSDHKYRKHDGDNRCTRNRNSKADSETECTPCSPVYKCTRGQRNNCKLSTDCNEHQFQTESEFFPTESCPCNTFRSTFQTRFISCVYNRNTNHGCADENLSTKPCQSWLRTLKDLSEDNFNKNDFNYDYLYPNFNSYNPRTLTKSPYEPRLKSNTDKLNLNRKRVFPRNRKRSVPEEINFRPFWQVDEYTNNNQPQLKSIRFTTLSNKKFKSRRTKKTTKNPVKTESITIPFETQTGMSTKRITEKYLSFDELLHLRKYNAELNARRTNEGSAKSDPYNGIPILRADTTQAPTTTTATTAATEGSTSEYTANTPYIRIKYCTRKLTCTWTAASVTDSDGSIITENRNNVGSRTPPGYVEGCTRTSTCTRDFMNRNKMATLPAEVTSIETDTGDDEDYCERRSLNKRNINKNKTIQTNTISTLLSTSVSDSPSYLEYNINQSSMKKFSDSNTLRAKYRKKRLISTRNATQTSNFHIIKRENKCQSESNVLSYGDIYYLVTKQIIKLWQKKKNKHNKLCLCNHVSKFKSSNFVVTLVVALTIIK